MALIKKYNFTHDSWGRCLEWSRASSGEKELCKQIHNLELVYDEQTCLVVRFQNPELARFHYSMKLVIYQHLPTGISSVILQLETNTSKCQFVYGFNQFKTRALRKWSTISTKSLYSVIYSEIAYSPRRYRIFRKSMFRVSKNIYIWFLEMFPGDEKYGPIRIILLNICLALAPLDLPPYIILEIIDWLPYFSDCKVKHGWKIKWIIAAKESIKRCWNQRKGIIQAPKN